MGQGESDREGWLGRDGRRKPPLAVAKPLEFAGFLFCELRHTHVDRMVSH